MRLAVATVALVLLSACSASHGHTQAASTPRASTPTALSVAGTLTLYGPISTGVDAMTTGAPCTGISDGYPGENFEDITGGATIEVRDGSGAVVGVGTLGAGVMSKVNPPEARECRFQYDVTRITPGRGFYTATFGSHSSKTIPEGELATSLGNLAYRSVAYAP